MGVQRLQVNSDVINDEILWSKFKRGNELVFTQIYQRYINALFHYGERLTSDKALIEDAIHDLFLDLWRNKKNLEEVKVIKSYLFKGLRRVVIKKLIKKRKSPFQDHFSQDYQFELVFSHENDLIKNEEVFEKEKKLLRAVNQVLTPRQKEAVTLKFYDNLSYEEVAAIMSLSTKSTYKLIYRALEVLKTYLDTILLLMLPCLIA